MNRELHKAGERSCMHIELDITGSKIKYVFYHKPVHAFFKICVPFLLLYMKAYCYK